MAKRQKVKLVVQQTAVIPANANDEDIPSSLRICTDDRREELLVLTPGNKPLVVSAEDLLDGLTQLGLVE